MSVSRVV